MALPIELLTLILARLPVKSLSRFKSVSKEWYSLISTPTLAELQTYHSPRGGHLDDHKLIGVHREKDNRLRYIEWRGLDSQLTLISRFDLPLIIDDIMYRRRIGYFEFLCSCRGLVILQQIHYADFSYKLIMWNPSTNNYSVLPLPDLCKPRFDDDCVYVFGYDKSNNDYKLVWLSCGGNNNVNFEDICSYSMQVYSSKRNCWGKPTIIKNTDGLRLDHQSSLNDVLIDDSIINWYLTDDFDYMGKIRGFDISSEEWLDVPLPDLPQGHKFGELGVLDNCLCINSFLKEELVDWSSSSIKDETVDIWVMKEYGKESWIKLFSFPNYGSVNWERRAEDGEYWERPPVASSRAGDEVLMRISYPKYYCYQWYNFKDGTMKSEGHCKDVECRKYVASLVHVPTKDGSFIRRMQQ